MPSFCACGAARCRNGIALSVVPPVHESVQRSSDRLAPFSCWLNQAPPSSANLPMSSATPNVIGPPARAASRVVVCAPAAPAVTAISAHASAHAAANFFIKLPSLVDLGPCSSPNRHGTSLHLGLVAHLSCRRDLPQDGIDEPGGAEAHRIVGRKARLGRCGGDRRPRLLVRRALPGGE